MKYYLLGLTICFCHFIALGQQSKIDSLLSLLKTDKEDTNKVNSLILLSVEFEFTNPDTAIILNTQALTLSETINWKKGIAKSYIRLGWEKYLQSDYPGALDYDFKALRTGEETENKKIISSALGSIGLVYMEQGDYSKALDYYFHALKIEEELGNKNRIAIQLGNIGNVYLSQGEACSPEKVGTGISSECEKLFNKALDYYFKALKLEQELGNNNGIAIQLGSIGLVYKELGEAHPSEKVWTKIPSQRQELFNKAQDYYFRALKIEEDLGDKNNIAAILGNIGSLYTEAPSLPSPLGEEQKGYILAEKYLLKALKSDKEIGALNEERQVEELLTELYTKTNHYQLALEHYKKAMALKDTLFNIEKDKKLTRKEMTYQFEKKEAMAKAEQEKKDALAKEELKQKEQQRNYSIVGFALIGLLALFIFRGYRQKKKANIIITEQKGEVEKKSKIIEVKNKDITDSINYAKRIQQAKLPDKEQIYSSLPQSFVLFKPKDIVSGDFYFFHKNVQSVFIASADCTGHGVPGAFMSMIGSEKLDDALAHSADTSEILRHLNKGIKVSLRQTDSNESTRDGMDIALCSIDTENRVVKYAGANRPLWIIRNGQTVVEEIIATKKAIGGFTEDNQHFDSHEIKFQQGDTFYLSTDGYADTFGGKDNKKMTTKKFKQILLDIQHKTMKEQEQHLDNFVENWKAGAEQVDDILVIGVRL